MSVHQHANILQLWGDGQSCANVSGPRLTDFNTAVKSKRPDIMFGFYEPDCTCYDSSSIDYTTGQAMWKEYLKPLGDAGTTLGSPSMCTQKDESWLRKFTNITSTKPYIPWDVTSVHINKPNATAAIVDLNYYLGTYGKPIWVSEFACVDDVSWTPCTDQTQIDDYITQLVTYFNKNESIVAYGPSNGNGLGKVWPLIDQETGKLSATGQTYLKAISSV